MLLTTFILLEYKNDKVSLLWGGIMAWCRQVFFLLEGFAADDGDAVDHDGHDDVDHGDDNDDDADEGG